jgi:pimeloyl-ACP methyl ester carboxylesterase
MTTTIDVTDTAASSQRQIGQPDLWLQVVALLGLPIEVGAFITTWPLLGGLGRGDRHPVLVLPGFMGDDTSTVPLRTLIRGWGHDVYGWGQRANPGPTAEVLAALDERLVSVYRTHERRVTLIGWSAGGRYARHLAREHPEMVRQVITLACPIQYRIGVDRTSISFIVDQVKHTFAPGFGNTPEHEMGPLPVPATSIYSRTDGVIRWFACLDVADDQHENVEVFASHVGVGMNPAVVYVIADRLSQPEDGWRPFDPPGLLRTIYPPAPSWEPR